MVRRNSAQLLRPGHARIAALDGGQTNVVLVVQPHHRARVVKVIVTADSQTSGIFQQRGTQFALPVDRRCQHPLIDDLIDRGCEMDAEAIHLRPTARHDPAIVLAQDRLAVITAHIRGALSTSRTGSAGAISHAV